MCSMPHRIDDQWERSAACADRGAESARLFFSDDPTEIATAKQVCALCPVITECLDTAIENREQWGVWGGQLFIDGRIASIKRRPGRPPAVPNPDDEIPMLPLPDRHRHLLSR